MEDQEMGQWWKMPNKAMESVQNQNKSISLLNYQLTKIASSIKVVLI